MTPLIYFFEKFISLYDATPFDPSSLRDDLQYQLTLFVQEADTAWDKLIEEQAPSADDPATLTQCRDQYSQDLSEKWDAIVNAHLTQLQTKHPDSPIDKSLYLLTPAEIRVALDQLRAQENLDPLLEDPSYRAIQAADLTTNQVFSNFVLHDESNTRVTKHYRGEATTQQLTKLFIEQNKNRDIRNRSENKLRLKSNQNQYQKSNLLLSALLNAMHSASKSKSPLYLAALTRSYKKMMAIVIWSQDEILQKTAFEAHQAHYLKLIDSKDTVNEAHLQQFTAAMLRMEQQNVFGAQQKFSEWQTSKRTPSVPRPPYLVAMKTPSRDRLLITQNLKKLRRKIPLTHYPN